MKIKILLCLFGGLLLFGSSYAIETEPNNTPAQANTLALNGRGSGAINPAGDVDWWKVKTTGDGRLDVTLTPLSGRNTYVYLYDTTGVVLLTGNFSTSTFTISQDGLAAGTYYMKVVCYFSTDTSSYIISNTLTQPAQANDAEPNDTKAQANTLALNGNTTGHVGYYYNNRRDTADWYKVTTNADGLLRLSLTPANGNAVYVTLYDNDGVTVLNSAFTYAAFNLSTDGLAAGTYYLRIYCYYNYQFSPYTLADSLFTYNANDAEPNDTKAQANTLALNGSTTGHVGFYYNNHRDTADWYKVTTNADGLLRLSLTPANGNAVYVTLYDNDGVTVLNSAFTYAAFNLSTDGLAAGTYYLRIYCYYNSQFSTYTLADSLFTYNANDVEPNRYFSQAATIFANRTVNGHVGFYYNVARDTADTWKINYTGSGNLQLTFNLLPHNVDGSYRPTYFLVYKDTTAAPVYSSFFTAPSTVVNLSSLTQGYYYIKVFEYYNYDFEAYSITDSFTQVNIANISLVKAASSVNSCGSDSLVFSLSASHSPYTVRLFRDGSLFDSLVTTSDTARFTGLNNGNYYATVYGDGATDSVYGKSGTSQFLPVYPTGLFTTNVGAHTATLNWSALNCVKNYIVQYKVTGSPGWITVNTPTDTTGNYILTGLIYNTMYTYQVASLDSADGLLSQYSDTATFKTVAALPVTFINFDGTLCTNQALLNWSTATEINNKGFEVEKSTDGQTFAAIGFVQGNGNSSILNKYTYTDNKILSGFNYYRLKQIDIDGNFDYSSTIRLDFKNFDWAIFGNPATSNSWLQLQLGHNANVAIQIISIEGKIIQTINKGNISEGTYSIPLNLANATSGMHIVKLIIDNQSFAKKIIK